MNNVIFVVGGARSGKSSYAVDLAKTSGQKTVFLATCTFRDEEMTERIRRHQKDRPSWEVITEGQNISGVTEKLQGAGITVLIDCLGMWVFNLMEVHPQNEPIEEEFKKFTNVLSKSQGLIIVVSNEVGMSIVPDNPSGRRFRDLLGRLNQMTARVASEVVFMQVGLPMKLKTRGEGV
jgi:adenosylcobinamide kinase/adenosylcobinamide-phosphate guanylyltransferase